MLQNRKGRVSRADLRNILEKFNFRLQDSQFKQLMEKVDPHHTNNISYQKFLALFEETDGPVSIWVKNSVKTGTALTRYSKT